MPLTGFTLNEIIKQHQWGSWQWRNRHSATWFSVYPLFSIGGSKITSPSPFLLLFSVVDCKFVLQVFRRRYCLFFSFCVYFLSKWLYICLCAVICIVVLMISNSDNSVFSSHVCVYDLCIYSFAFFQSLMLILYLLHKRVSTGSFKV